MPRAFVVSEVRTLTKVVAAFAVALLALALWTAPAWAAPDLSITKAGPAKVEPGERFVYTIVVTNTGDVATTNVVVTDRLPPGVTFVESDPAGCTAGVDPDPSRRLVTCPPIATLAPGATRTIVLTVTAPLDVGVIANRATVDSNETEPENSNTVTTRVLPNIVIDKLDDRDPVRVGGNVLYTLRVTNEGSATIGPNDLVVIDELPIGDVRLVSVDSNFFDCDPLDPPTGRIRCESRADFGPEDTASIKITVDPDEAGTIRNTAEVRVEGVRVDRDTEETTVKADAEETTAEETTGEQTTDQKTTDEQTIVIDGQTTVIDGQTILIPDELADTTLPETGGPSGIALAAGCALLGVSLIINKIFR